MSDTTYKVAGMTCGGCVRSVSAAIQRAVPGVDVVVTLDSGEVRVAGDHDEASVRDAVEDAGFDFEGRAEGA